MSRVRADTITNKTGDGPTDFPNGFTANSGTVTGLLTATTYDMTQLNVSGVSTQGGVVKITDTTVSTSSTTGSLVISGGVGIGKRLYVDGNISCAGTVYSEDIINLDSLGIVTGREGLRATAGGLVITAGVSTFAAALDVNSSVDIAGETNVSSGGFKVGSGVSVSNVGLTTLSKGLHLQGGGLLREKCYIRTNPWSNTTDFQIQYGMVQYNSGNLAGTGNTLNVFSDVGINTSMSIGESITVTGITSVNASTAYIHHLQVDHNQVQVLWNGGAPTAGGASGMDAYSFNIIKTGIGTFVAIGNRINMTS